MHLVGPRIVLTIKCHVIQSESLPAQVYTMPLPSTSLCSSKVIDDRLTEEQTTLPFDYNADQYI